jgi:hypothetical protein
MNEREVFLQRNPALEKWDFGLSLPLKWVNYFLNSPLQKIKKTGFILSCLFLTL